MLVLLAGGTGTAFAQQESAQVAQADPQTADRQALRDFLAREEVQKVARTSGVDLSDAERGLLALDGERLSRAADQARAIDRELGAAQEIRLSATVIIIILLLIIIIVVAA
jgi:predicted transcriptional regulator